MPLCMASKALLAGRLLVMTRVPTFIGGAVVLEIWNLKGVPRDICLFISPPTCLKGMGVSCSS